MGRSACRLVRRTQYPERMSHVVPSGQASRSTTQLPRSYIGHPSRSREQSAELKVRVTVGPNAPRRADRFFRVRVVMIACHFR